jgi:hypothetical protein
LKSLFFLFTTIGILIYSSSSFAITDTELKNKCLEAGKAKIELEAETFGCSVDLNKVEVNEIDNRWYNPSKYIWYEVVGECNGYDRIIKLVQLYNGKCF